MQVGQGLAQIKRINGRVIDKNGHAIPYTNIEVRDSFVGWSTDDEGLFSIRFNKDSVKYLVIYKRGYIKQEFFTDTLGKDSLIVRLTERASDLKEVTVHSTRKKKLKEGLLGRSRLTCNGRSYMAYGDEEAIYLEAVHPERHGYLKEIFIYITDEGIPDTKFRVHVYDEDTNTGDPLHDITDSVIITHATKGNEWVRVDISDKLIPVKNGLFVSVEWLAGYGNDPRKIQMSNLKPYWVGGSLSKGWELGKGYYNGQVLGLTFKYGIQPIDYANFEQDDGTRKLFNTESPYFNKGSWLHRNRWVNPMIYCTYNYTNK